MNGRLFIKMKA